MTISGSFLKVRCPGLGIDVFRSCFRSHFEVVHLGYQFFCRKVSHAPPAVGPLTSTDAMEGEAATTAITSPDVPGDWMRCFERCTTSNVSCQVLMLGAIPEHLSAWLVTNKNSGTTIVPCAATVSGLKLEPQQGTPSEAPTASAQPGTQAQPKSSMDMNRSSLVCFMSARDPQNSIFNSGGCGRRLQLPALARYSVRATSISGVLLPLAMVPSMQLATDGLCAV